MASDNDQQQEIVLGNKQLLSIFFIVVVLLGVSFTIGYMIGKNTATVSAAGVSGSGVAALSTHQAAPVDSEPTPDRPASSDPAPAPEQLAPKPSGTQPAKPYDGSGGADAKVSAAKPERPAVDSAAAAGTGNYLQVAALKHEDADHIVKVLRDRGYPALLGESPKPGLFRVLVGPFKTMADLSDSKQKLRAAGFETIVAR